MKETLGWMPPDAMVGRLNRDCPLIKPDIKMGDEIWFPSMANPGPFRWHWPDWERCRKPKEAPVQITILRETQEP